MTQRTINWKLLAVSVVTAIVVAVAVGFLHSWQLSRLANGLLRIAETREAAEKWQEAAAYCDRYLRVHPDDVQVRGRLATVFANGATTGAEIARAVELHYRALAVKPDRDQELDLRSALAKLLLQSGRLLDAEQEAVSVLKVKADEPSASRTLALAMCARWENGAVDSDKLKDLNLLSVVKKARERNPHDIPLAEITAALYRDHAKVVAADPDSSELTIEERAKRADECLNSLVERRPDDPKVYLARYRYHTRYGLTGAEGDIAKALEIAPEDEEVVLVAAKVAFQNVLRMKSAGAPEAETNAELGRAKLLYEGLAGGEKTTRIPDAYFGLGESMLLQGNLDGAVGAWRMGLKQFPVPTIQILFLSRISDAYLNSDRPEEAGDSLDAVDKLVSTLGSSVPREQRLRLMQSQDLRRASWHMKRNAVTLAIPILQEVIAREGNTASGDTTLAIAWSALAQANARSGDLLEAAAAFDRALPLDPKSAGLRLAAGTAWLQVARPDLAVDRFEQSLALQPSTEGMLLLAMAEGERQRLKPAKQRNWQQLDRTLSALEPEPGAVIKVQSPWRLDFLRADLELLRAGTPGDQRQGMKKAVEVLKDAETKHAESEEFWRLAIAVYQRLGDSEAADRALAQFVKLSKSPAEQAIAKSRLASLRGDLTLAKQVLEDASRQAIQIDQSKLRLALIDVAFASGDKALRAQLLATEAQQRPSDVNLLRNCCEAALQLDDSKSAAKWADELAKCGEVGKWWSRYYRTIQSVAGVTSASDRKLVEALDETEKLISIRPHWPMGHSLRGTLLERRGKLEEAANALEHAVQLGERKLATFQLLAAVHTRLAANLLGSSPGKAEQSLRKVLDVDSRSPTARRMLASLLASRGDPAYLEEAEELLRSVDPTTASVAVEDIRLNGFLLAQYGEARQVARGVELLEGVVAKGDGSTADDRLILAQIYESQARNSPDPMTAAEKRQAAHEQFLAVASLPDAQPGYLAALIDFLTRKNDLSEAEEWLNKLEAKLNAKPMDDPGAIGQLIELRMRHGSGNQCERWLERLAAADTDPFRPTAMRAGWLANQKRNAEIESLVEPVALQTVAAATGDVERGRRARSIGDLYIRTGQKQAAQRWYQNAVGYDRAQLPALVRALAMSGEITEAIRLCHEQSDGDLSTQAATVLASVLAETNVQETVDSNVDQFLSTKIKLHPQDSRLLYAVATLRAVQGRYDESIEHYRSLIKLEPRNVGAMNNLAVMLAESPETRAESIRVIDKAIEIAGEQPGLLDTKGTILVYLGESQNALFLLEAAAREAGTDARHHFHLAAAYHGIGEMMKAKQQLTSAIAMNLEQQVLTPTDRRILAELKATLLKPSAEDAISQ